MEFIGITGPVKRIDEITEKYLADKDFHLENSLTELRVYLLLALLQMKIHTKNYLLSRKIWLVFSLMKK